MPRILPMAFQVLTSFCNKMQQDWISAFLKMSQLPTIPLKEAFIVCDRLQTWKQLNIGQSQWVNIPAYQEPKRMFMTMTEVDGKIFIAGGRDFLKNVKLYPPLFVKQGRL